MLRHRCKHHGRVGHCGSSSAAAHLQVIYQRYSKRCGPYVHLLNIKSGTGAWSEGHTCAMADAMRETASVTAAALMSCSFCTVPPSLDAPCSPQTMLAS